MTGCPSTTSPELLTVVEACGLLRISRWTLSRLIRERQLQSIKLGERRLIPRRAIDDLISRLQEVS